MNRLKILLLRVMPVLVTVYQFQQPFIVILVQRVSGAGFLLCCFIQLLQNTLHHVIWLFYPINQVKTFRSLIQRNKSELTKRILRYFLNTGCGQPATFRSYLIVCRILVTGQRVPLSINAWYFCQCQNTRPLCFSTACCYSGIALVKQRCISFPGQINRRILSRLSRIGDELFHIIHAQALYMHLVARAFAIFFR
ncbi:Uncharacterised protein [Enterobacter hormaechei]|nr:Uncharacterised protein [Enterobacter hormaechei]VAG51329.1 Uncharacterised protein [Enterobacter hormaechei]